MCPDTIISINTKASIHTLTLGFIYYLKKNSVATLAAKYHWWNWVLPPTWIVLKTKTEGLLKKHYNSFLKNLTHTTMTKRVSKTSQINSRQLILIRFQNKNWKGVSSCCLDISAEGNSNYCEQRIKKYLNKPMIREYRKNTPQKKKQKIKRKMKNKKKKMKMKNKKKKMKMKNKKMKIK
jgi:hypothetical protein